jgi:sarcosine oxidase delta subunit
MTGKEADSEIDKVTVSDTIIRGSVDDISHGVGDVLYEILKNTNFTLQVDELTDTTNKAQLLVFVRFENEGEIMEIWFVVKNCQQQLKVKILSTFVHSFGILCFVVEPVCWNLQ